MTINTANLTDIEVEGIDLADYPDFCDAYISSAYDLVLERDLTDDELNELHDNHSDFVYECVMDRIH